ncbi:hypothetical protein, partial [Seonamhaeicola marinus]
NQLKALSNLSDKQHSKEKIKPHLQDSVLINNIKINGLNNYTRSYVLGKLKIKSNEKISYERLTNGINNIVA